MASPPSFTGLIWKNLKRRRLRTLLSRGVFAAANEVFAKRVIGRAARQLAKRMTARVEGLRGREEGCQSHASRGGIDAAGLGQRLLRPVANEAAGAKLKALPARRGAKLCALEALGHV